ncbi:MAG: X-Pro dipeptidyl-peptidase domain protein [Solirubrobacterales bacterium]|jgi:predicted acyl esterase|nr:X-Pro dipeptidyl-peptidase domain protein [Solirubrobacterales bacterium]
MRIRRCTLLSGAVLAATAMLAAGGIASAQAEPAPFGHACKAQNGVRFCPTEGLAQRVHTFDGVPLDVDVTLPPTGTGPFPTIVMLHGWGGSKTDFESSSPEGDGNSTFDYNNVYYAQHGYAVLNYSARGWGNSCGAASSREDPGCKEGWIRLADQRYEVRDTQTLLGMLADEHIAKVGALASTGISYGGGQSIELAYLKNRIRLPKGEFATWTSPKGKNLSITATFPRWPWSDLVDALTPNGRFLDTEVAPFAQSYEPFGVEIQSYVAGLFALGNASGFIAPSGADPEADLSKWFFATNAGEPATPEDETIAKQLYTYHQGYGLSGKPAPMLLESGWTDDLFPPSQSLRVYNAVRALKGYAALMVGDLGHSRGSNKENTDHAFNEEGAAFLQSKLQHSATAPANGSVTAYTQTCPQNAAAGGPFTAKNWAKLHRHAVTISSTAAQTFTSAGGNATIATEFDPIGGTSDACKAVKAETEPDTANYTLVSPGFTLMGLPTVTASIKTTGPFGELVSRLWDVLPGGEQRLISRGVYRLNENQTGTVTFQLHGNGYEFAKGDTVKLQLLGRDAPYYRASNGAFSIEVTNVTASLPTP